MQKNKFYKERMRKKLSFTEPFLTHFGHILKPFLGKNWLPLFPQFDTNVFLAPFEHKIFYNCTSTCCTFIILLIKERYKLNDRSPPAPPCSASCCHFLQCLHRCISVPVKWCAVWVVYKVHVCQALVSCCSQRMVFPQLLSPSLLFLNVFGFCLIYLTLTVKGRRWRQCVHGVCRFCLCFSFCCYIIKQSVILLGNYRSPDWTNIRVCLYVNLSFFDN